MKRVFTIFLLSYFEYCQNSLIYYGWSPLQQCHNIEVNKKKEKKEGKKKKTCFRCSGQVIFKNSTLKKIDIKINNNKNKIKNTAKCENILYTQQFREAC